MNGKKLGYVRVSTEQQNNARQVEIMTNYRTDRDFMEYVSGKNTKRAELQALLDYAREGDTVYVESYSRLARNTIDLLDIVSKLEANGVALVSHKEQTDTSTAQGKLMLTVFGALAEFERECLLERQREGIGIAKEQGKYKGRPEKDIPEFEEYYMLWKEEEITATEVCKKLGISRSTFYRRIYKMEHCWAIVENPELEHDIKMVEA